MLGVKITHKGDFKATEKFLRDVKKKQFLKKLDQYGKLGVTALSKATPVDTGLTASSWDYKVEYKGTTVSIVWTNSNVNKGVNIAFILQYGHGTRNGGYVAGRDYINPAMQPVFDKIADEVWAEVTKL